MSSALRRTNTWRSLRPIGPTLNSGPRTSEGGYDSMECFHCKGRMVRATAPFSIDRKGYHIVWEAIPAWVCTQCGEPFFEAGEVEAIQRSLEAVDRESAALIA